MRVNFFKLLISFGMVMACYCVFAQTDITNVYQCKAQLDNCEKFQSNQSYFCAEAGQLAASNCFVDLDGPIAGKCNYNFMAGIRGGIECENSHRCRFDFMMGIDGGPDCSISSSYPICMAKRQSAQEYCMANFETIVENGASYNSCLSQFQTCLEKIDSQVLKRR
jgi:hypothetical protein